MKRPLRILASVLQASRARSAPAAGVPFEGAVMKSVLIDNSLKSDIVHPKGKGYARIAAAVERALKKSGAI
jgi:lysophospholipase L1-like esterase